jgi:translation initiation factor eIF-2B subunit epsilon
MRELDAKQIVTSDFILITGDVVSNLALMDVVNEHKARRKISKNCIMTMVMKPSNGGDRPRCVCRSWTLGLDSDVLSLDVVSIHLPSF